MGAVLVIVLKVGTYEPNEMALSEDENVFQARARPAFALERLIAKLTPIGSSTGFPSLSPIPVPRCPSRSKELLDLRAAVTAYGSDATATATDAPAYATPPALSVPGARTARYHWAILLARLFTTFPLVCPQCGAALRLIAFVTAAEPVTRILTHLSEPAEPPRIAPARGPPAWDELLAPLPDWDAPAQPTEVVVRIIVQCRPC